MSSGHGSQAPPIPSELTQRLTQAAGSLQMLPAVAMQAMQIANSPECDFLKLANVIQRDLKLTTFILRMANSSMYSPTAPIASLHHAISVMGLKRCRDMILTAGMDSVAKKVPPELSEKRELLWRHSFLTAIFAVKINHLLGLKFQGEEYTAGLMHDFGRTLLAVATPEQFVAVDPLDFNEPDNIESRERGQIATSHAEFGAWFASLNELPPALVAAIRYHHCPENAGEHAHLAGLVAAADHVANHVQRADQPSEYNPMTNGALVVLQQSGAMNATGKFSDAIDKFLEDAPKIAAELMRE
jgi:HD-like signal output (HDOD) protein